MPSFLAADRFALATAGLGVEVSGGQAEHRKLASAATGGVVNPNLVEPSTILAFVGTLAFTGLPVVETVVRVSCAVVAVGLTLVEFVPNGVVRRVLPIVENDP